MKALFLELLDRSLSAGWVVLAVVLLRLCLQKAPKWSRCLLWGLVAIRLLLPCSIQSQWSLMPPQTALQVLEPALSQPVLPSAGNAPERVEPLPSPSQAVSPEGEEGPDLLTLAAGLWLAGAGAMGLYGAVSYLRLRRRVAPSLETEPGVRLCDDIDTPFLLGLLRPVIYLPSDLEGEQRRWVLAHERAHLRRRDHWWKPLGFLLLTVYWFHPLLWLAYWLLARDIELACDEAVIREMTGEEKRAYAGALLACSLPRREIGACPLAFGEVGVRDRVKSVLRHRKPALWLALLALLACAGGALTLLTDPQEEIALTQEEIFGHSYTVEDILYQDGRASFGYVDESVTPRYRLTADLRLEIQEQLEGEAWLSAGTFQPAELTEEALAGALQEGQEGIWQDPAGGPAGLWQENEKAWSLTVSEAAGSAAYLLLAQKDGSLLLAVGSRKEALSIRWIFRLTRSDRLLCRLEGPEGERSLSVGYTADEAMAADRLRPPLNRADWQEETLVFAPEEGWSSLALTAIFQLGEGESTRQTDLLKPEADGTFRFSLSALCSSGDCPTSGEIWVSGPAGERWFFRLAREEEPGTVIGGEGGVTYEYLLSPDPIPPSLTLWPEEGTFAFSWSAFSSYLCWGSYEQDGNELLLQTEDGSYHFRFWLRQERWYFDAGASSPIPSYSYGEKGTLPPVPDGACFILREGAEQSREP